MARKPTSPAKPSKELSAADKQSVVSRLQSRIAELKVLDLGSINEGDDPSIQELLGRIRSTLSNIFGEGSSEYERLVEAAQLDATSYLSFLNSDRGPSVSEIRAGIDKGRRRAVAILQGEVDSLKEDLQFSGPQSTGLLPTPKSAMSLSNEIFIVHGRDDAAKIEVARLVERAGLEAVILHEQANGGRTIIQKFEDHGSAAGFAIIIMTPDDIGGLDKDSLQPRARQNVIGEMFWFAGRLGRERVCALKRGAIEVPTDFAGVGYVDMDTSGAWKKDLLRELEHAGYKNLDWQKALA